MWGVEMLIESWLRTFAERVQDLRDEATVHGYPAAARRLDTALLECRASIETSRRLRSIIGSVQREGEAHAHTDRITRMVLDGTVSPDGSGARGGR